MKLNYTLLLLFFIMLGCEDIEDPESIISINFETDDRSYQFTEVHLNSYYIGANQDQLSLVMTDESNFSCEIHIQQSNLLQREFPFSIPNAGNNTNGEIQIRNNNINVSPIFGPDDDVNFVGVTFEDLEITILSLEDGLLIGSFRGPVRTKTGREMTIEKGVFKVHIKIEEGA